MYFQQWFVYIYQCIDLLDLITTFPTTHMGDQKCDNFIESPEVNFARAGSKTDKEQVNWGGCAKRRRKSVT